MLCFIYFIVFGSLYFDIQEVNTLVPILSPFIDYKYFVTALFFYNEEKGEEDTFEHLPFKSPFSLGYQLK